MNGRLAPWWLAAAWLAGVALQLQQAALWAWPVYAGLGVAGGALVAGGRRVVRSVLPARSALWARSAVLTMFTLTGAAVLAFGATGWRADERLADELPAALQGQDLQLTGVIAQMPRSTAAGTRFLFEVEAARHDGQAVHVPPLISLGWYPERDAARAAAAPDWRAGQRWRLTVRLKQPHGSLNPHGFDLELWLFEQGIRAGGYVRSGPAAANVLLAENVAHPFEGARQRVRDALYARVDDATRAGVLAALAVGDQAAIDRDGWDLFRTTGVAHLMSISGLHITMIAWLVGLATGALWRRSARLMLWLPAPQAARCGGLAAALMYALLAGWGVPAQRTVWMIASVVLLRSGGRRWPMPAVLLAAAVVVTAMDPWALLQPGFWLSFVAVGMLIASEAVRAGGPARAAPPPGWGARARAALRGGLRSQLVATVGLAPLSMVFFQQVSLVGFAANLVAIPVVTLLITPLALLGVLLPPLWTAAAAVVHLLMLYLGWLAAWPFAVWTAAAAPPWAVAVGLLGGLLLVLPLPARLRALSVPLLVPLLFPVVARPAPGGFEIVAADIGQGTSVLVRTAGHLLVFDTGPQYAVDADAGQRVLLPLLRARGERRIDMLVLSHKDADHVGGAASLLAGTVVREIVSSLPEDHALLQRGVPHRRCEAGQSWLWDGVRFEMLHPSAAQFAAASKPNAVSCVLHVAGTHRSLLLTGDIEAAQEAALLARGAALHADVLQVPHHGSRTSSGSGFIAAVAPQIAFVQAGYRNRFHHPAPDVVARYGAQGVPLVRSDRCGAWTLPDAGPARCERLRARRYWHHQPPPDAP